MSEMLDLYDQYRQALKGQVVERGHQLPEGTYHLVVHVCVFNQKGEMLIQQRKQDKKLWPGLWDFSAAGAVMQGETSNQAAQREVKEELNLDLDFTLMRPQLAMTYTAGFDDIYLIQGDIDETDITIEPEEVEAIRFVNRETLLNMLDSKTFINYKPGLISLIFDFIASQNDGMYQS
ncbi:NUDIX domain-containing protein [Staphylococcus simulans]|uniref:NUDIX hydrolase n=1 Tax=Staphylococcus simulans TaxID=1286 RepID=UPI001E29BC71|nr:NUDIX domain-containing protein [Staphylococcus simulans]MCD8914327.1 NUDIX domain-containing protein [Staphylococcus simulans]